jgi:hypothetical protein
LNAIEFFENLGNGLQEIGALPQVAFADGDEVGETLGSVLDVLTLTDLLEFDVLVGCWDLAEPELDAPRSEWLDNSAVNNSALLRYVVADDAESGLFRIVLYRTAQGVLGISRHVVSLVQNDQLVRGTFEVSVALERRTCSGSSQESARRTS